MKIIHFFRPLRIVQFLKKTFLFFNNSLWTNHREHDGKAFLGNHIHIPTPPPTLSPRSTLPPEILSPPGHGEEKCSLGRHSNATLGLQWYFHLGPVGVAQEGSSYFRRLHGCLKFHLFEGPFLSCISPSSVSTKRQ